MGGPFQTPERLKPFQVKSLRLEAVTDESSNCRIMVSNSMPSKDSTDQALTALKSRGLPRTWESEGPRDLPSRSARRAHGDAAICKITECQKQSQQTSSSSEVKHGGDYIARNVAGNGDTATTGGADAKTCIKVDGKKRLLRALPNS